MLPQGLKYCSQMVSMPFLILRIDKDVVYEHHYKLVQIRSENPVHKAHEGCRSVSETKRHHCELIMTIPGSKCCLRNVIRFNPKLMVP